MRTLLLLFILILLLGVLVKRLDSPEYSDDWYDRQGGYSMAEGGGEQRHKSINSPITPTLRNSSILDHMRAFIPATVGSYAIKLYEDSLLDSNEMYPTYKGLETSDRYNTVVDAIRHGAAAMRYGLPAMTGFEKVDDNDTMDYTNNELATGWKSSTPNASQSSRDRGWSNAVVAELQSQMGGWLPGIATGMPISFDRRSKGEPTSPLSELYSQMGYGRPMIDGSWNPGIGFQRYTRENEPAIGTQRRPSRDRRTNYGPAMEGGTTGSMGQGLWT